MYSYDYKTPVRPRIIGGDGVVARLPEVVDKLNLKRVLVLTSPTYAKTTVTPSVLSALGNRVVETFTEVERHPSEGSVKRVAEIARKVKCDAVVALGGGSVIDTGKSVNWYLDEKAEKSLVTNIAIPSTLSGAEFTQTAGITMNGTKHLLDHARLQPHVVIYDPQVAAVMPRSLLQGSLLNAMDHCLEGLMSIDRSPMTDASYIHAIKLLRQASDLSTSEKLSDAQAGAAMAVYDMTILLPGLAHGLAHVLGGRCRTPHHFNHGLVAAPVMRYNFSVVPGQQRMIAEAFGVDTDGLNEKDAAWKAICAVKDLVTRMGAPKGLRELGVKESDLPILAELVMHDPYAHSNPRKVTPTQAEQVLRWAWTGEIPAMDQHGID